jgi:diguanylate cyclase (GGDEF)-like protein
MWPSLRRARLADTAHAAAIASMWVVAAALWTRFGWSPGLEACAFAALATFAAVDRRGMSRSRSELAALVGSMSDAVIALDRKGRIAKAFAPEGMDLMEGAGFPVGASMFKLLPPAARPRYIDAVKRLSRKESPSPSEVFDFVGANALGEEVHVQATVSRVGEESIDSDYLVVLRDISIRKLAELSHHDQAMVDELTRLPNRRHLEIKMAEAMERAQLGALGALLFIDMDHFKKLNDSLGHEAGDAMLREVALRIRGTLGANDMAARVGGDEFVVMLQGLSDHARQAEDQAMESAELIRGALDIPYDLSGREFHSTPSIGVSMLGPGLGSAQDALRRADLAMYEAKAHGKNAARLFEPAMEDRARASANLQEDLARLASSEAPGDELRLVFQPKLDANGRFVGAETLVRWEHPTRGGVSPGSFIPMAESSGHIIPIGRWVMEQSMVRAALWRDQLVAAGATISFNVSPLQFSQDDFVATVELELRGSGAAPGTLTIEITESVLMSRQASAVKKLGELRAMGLRVSLDDFGTGFSSLSYLKNFDVDEFKIDQSFVRDIVTDAKSQAIVSALADLGRRLGVWVVAEGVEKQEQWRKLKELGVDAGQGYLFGHPAEIEEFEVLWLDASHLDASAPDSAILARPCFGHCRSESPIPAGIPCPLE